MIPHLLVVSLILILSPTTSQDITRTPFTYIQPPFDIPNPAYPNGTDNPLSSTGGCAGGYYNLNPDGTPQLTAYDSAVIPPRSDARWTPCVYPFCTDFLMLYVSRNSRFYESNIPCHQNVDYTYYQTILTIPVGADISSLSIALYADEGVRLTIFNSLYPNGVTPFNGYACFPAFVSISLSYLTTGQNRLVITQVDDCGPRSDAMVWITLNGALLLPSCPACTTLNPLTRICDADSNQNGASCNDENLCISNGQCSFGTCNGTPCPNFTLNQCSQPVCNGYGICTNKVPNGTACDDGNLCTSNDICNAGICAGTPYSCPPPGQCFRNGTCNGNGTCTNNFQPNGTLCDDLKRCTVSDTCQNGICVGTYACCTHKTDCGICRPNCGEDYRAEVLTFFGQPVGDKKGIKNIGGSKCGHRMHCCGPKDQSGLGVVNNICSY